VNSGIREVKFLKKYRNEEGIRFLQESGIAVVDMGEMADESKR
jgi:hypothetical protein